MRSARQSAASDQLVSARTNHNPLTWPSAHFQGRTKVQFCEIENLTNIVYRLEIPRLKKEDAGEYYCVAQNEVGSTSDFVTVEIIGS